MPGAGAPYSRDAAGRSRLRAGESACLDRAPQAADVRLRSGDKTVLIRVLNRIGPQRAPVAHPHETLAKPAWRTGPATTHEERGHNPDDQDQLRSFPPPGHQPFLRNRRGRAKLTWVKVERSCPT